MVNFRKRILIDLDGVLNDYCGEYNKHKIPKPKVDAEDLSGIFHWRKNG